MLKWHAFLGKTIINQMVMSYYTILEWSILAIKRKDNNRNKRVHPVNECASKQHMVAALKAEAVFS